MRRIVTAIAFSLTLAAVHAHAWCRMTTSRRMATALEPCIFPDPSTDPPEMFLEWRRPCSAMSLSTAAPSSQLTSDQVAGILERSIRTWESVTCDGVPFGIDIGILVESSECRGPLYRNGGGGNINTMMFVADWAARSYDPSAFAVTTVWHRRSTGEILDVDMEINELRGPYGECPTEGCFDGRLVDLENVVTHELGHYLGLAHSADPEATMYASAVAGETVKRDLAPDDIEGICTIYPPGTPEGVCDFTPTGGLQLDCVTGCSVATGRRASAFAPLFAIFLLVLRRRRAATAWRAARRLRSAA